MPKVKKKKKSVGLRGTHTHGRGFKKKARGSGHRGGFGNAGTGKRADQKKQMVVDGKKYFGSSKVRRAAPKIVIPTYSLNVINDNIESFVSKGTAKDNKGSYELNLEKYKIIGNEISIKVKINAHSASKGAIEAVKKAGGEIVVKEKEESS